MGWDGSGNYNRIFSWVDDATADIKILSNRHDSNDDDLAQAVSNTLTKDGQSQPTADIPMNGHKITNVKNPDLPQDAATKSYVDAIQTFSTKLDLSGADLNGRINFTSPTGSQGITWTGVDMSWISRVATAAGPGTPPVPPATINRLVLNDKADGTGADVIQMRENGTAEFAAGVTANSFFAKAASGNVHLWFYGPANEDRMVLYTNTAALGNTVLRVGGTQSFSFGTNGVFQAPNLVYAGSSYLSTDGNVSGTATCWANWGYQDAYTAIGARIEARATAWANDRVANLQYRKVSEGSSGLNADWRAPAGAVVHGYNRVGGNSGQVNYLYYKYLQIYDPVRGWVGFSEA